MTNKMVPSSSAFKNKNSPRQDYLSRLTGYGMTAIIVLTGYALNYFDSRVFIIALVCAIYPHLTFLISLPFRKNYHQVTRKILIHIDAVLCGVLLSYLHVSLELAVLFLIMINTSFIIVGSLSYWVFCIVSLAAGTVLGTYFFGDVSLGPVPPPLFLITSLGVGLHLAYIAYNANRQARDLIRLKLKYQSQLERFQILSQQASKYVAPQIWETIFSGRRQVRLETQRKKLVVFFSDIVGFSALSDQMEAEAFTDLLNQYLTDMSRIALKYGGTIDKFIGDGIMIFFGDPVSKGTKKDALACVSMAIEMRRHMLRLRQQWSELGISSPLQIRMGINTGYCTVGNFGTESRMDYTIVGKEVNLASRLESKADPGEILISHETYALIKDKIICRERGNTLVKGFRDPIHMYQVVDFRHALGGNSSYISQEAEGFSLYLESDKVKESDKERIAEELEKVARRLRNKITT